MPTVLTGKALKKYNRDRKRIQRERDEDEGYVQIVGRIHESRRDECHAMLEKFREPKASRRSA